MSWKAISPVLMVAAMCPACGGADRTSRTERCGVGAALSDTYAPEDVGDASGELTSSTEENAAPDEACTEEDAPERTGEAAQADEGYPEVRNPWGDGAPDGHAYSGGPSGGWGKDHDYHAAKKPIGSGGNYPRSVEELKRDKKRREQRALAWRTKAAIQEDFALFRSEARTGKRKRIGGGGTVDHNACTWTCNQSILGACQGIAALCAVNAEIMLVPGVAIPCASAFFAACLAGRAAGPLACESIVCAGVK
jgi:hypothetical protein